MRVAILAFLAAVAWLAPDAAFAQRIRRSQEAVVRQKLAGTWIEVHFRRPVARGRRLFGDVVEWGRVWTPGADTATSIAISTPLQIEGQTLPRGSYSIWMIPDSTGPWTVIFNKTTPVWHTEYPGEGRDQLRVRVTPAEGAHTESLLWYFPSVDGPDATLVMTWGTTTVPLRVHVGEP